MVAIGEVSIRSGVHVETIRYYERIGLTPKPARAANGRRDYDEKAAARFAFIRRARAMEFSLSEISHLLSLAENEATCREAHALATRHCSAIRTKIQELKQLERLLSRTAQRCARTSAAPCPVIEVLMESGR